VADGAGREAEVLAHVCATLNTLRADVRRITGGDEELLQRLMITVRAGNDITDLLDQLHELLQADGDALGLYGRLDVDPPNRALRPVGAGHDPVPNPTEIVYLCPVGRCSRYRWPQAGTTPPQCDVNESPMRRDRL